MPNFNFGFGSFTNFVNKTIGSYNSLSTMDQNDVIRERVMRSRNSNAKTSEKIAAHTDTINTLCVVRSGMILTGSRDKKIALTNTDVGEIAMVWEGHEMEVTKLAYRNTVAKHTILSGSRDSSINMWMFNNKNSVKSFTGHRMVVTGLAYVSDSNFASGSRDTTVKLWDIESGKTIRNVEINRNLVTHMVYSNYRNFIAQSSEDKTVRIWDPRDLSVIQELPRKRHIQMHCDFIDDDYMVSCSNGFNNDGCEITIYDVRTMKAVKELRGHEGSVQCVSTVEINDKKKMLVSVGADKTVRLWKLEDMSLVWTEEIPFETDHLQCCGYSDGHIILSGGYGRLAHYCAKFAAGRTIMDLQWTQIKPMTASTSAQF